MKLTGLKSRYWFWLILVVFFGFFLRSIHYGSFPALIETADERAWAWLGSSLIIDHQPTAWSEFPAYKKYQAVYQPLPHHAPLVRPFLDHPPLFSFIPGSMHLLQAQHWTDFPSQKAIRFPMLFIGTFNILLLGWLLKLYFPNKKDELINLLTTLTFASLPLIVFSSRMALADNLLATFSLVALISLKKRWFKILWLVIILAVLSKVQGAFIGGGLMIYFWLLKEKKLVVFSFISLLCGFFLFWLYGAYFNQALFFRILFGQSSRHTGLVTLLHRFLFHPTLTSHLWPTFTKALLFTSGLVIIFQSKLTKKDNYLPAASLIVGFFALSLLAVGETNINGWYEYAIYPVMFLGIRSLLEFIYKRANPLLVISFWFLAMLPLMRVALVAGLNSPNVNPHWVVILTILPFVSLLKPTNKKLNQGVFYLGFAILVIASGVTIITLTQGDYSNLTWQLLHY